MATTKKHSPLFHIVKRDASATMWYHRMLVRAIAIIAALLVSGVLITLLSEKNPIEVYSSMESNSLIFLKATDVSGYASL